MSADRHEWTPRVDLRDLAVTDQARACCESADRAFDSLSRGLPTTPVLFLMDRQLQRFMGAVRRDVIAEHGELHSIILMLTDDRAALHEQLTHLTTARDLEVAQLKHDQRLLRDTLTVLIHNLWAPLLTKRRFTGDEIMEVFREAGLAMPIEGAAVAPGTLDLTPLARELYDAALRARSTP